MGEVEIFMERRSNRALDISRRNCVSLSLKGDKSIVPKCLRKKRDVDGNTYIQGILGWINVKQEPQKACTGQG